MDYIRNLDVGFTDPPMKFIEAFDTSALMYWVQNNVDSTILDMMVKARELQDFDEIDGWYDPEKVIRSIECPVLLIQAGARAESFH